MAKKTPKAPPPPPPDDFDPDEILGEEIAPIDDAPIDVGDEAVEPVSEEVVVEPDDEVIEPDAAAVEEEPDLFGDLTPAVSSKETHLAGELDDLPPELESDLLIDPDEVSADETPSSEVSDEVSTEFDGFDSTEKGVHGEDFSPHDAETAAETPALDDSDDPFSGVGAAVGEGDDDAGELAPVGGGDDGGIDDPTEPYYEEEIPKPRTHWFTWTLIGLNIVAALAAPYMLVLAYAKRSEYTHAVYLTKLASLGLPNDAEEKAITSAKVTLPTFRVSAEELKRVMSNRGVKLTDPIKPLEEPYFERIIPSALSKELLKEHFGGEYVEDGGQLVKTVEDEARRLQKSVVGDIAKAADDGLTAVGDNPAKLRGEIERMLHPLPTNIYQAEKLDKRIQETQGDALKKLYLEAAQRRMAFDFLLPLELIRPGATKGMFLERIGDLEKLPLDKVLERVNQRIQSTIDEKYNPDLHLEDEGSEIVVWSALKRDTIERRLTISAMMLSLAHLKGPNGEKLYPKLIDRIPLVVGQYEFALACEMFPGLLLRVNEHVLDRIKIDREGAEVSAGKDANALLRNKRFIDFYEEELQRIRFVQQDIFKAKIRLADLEKQKKRYEQLLTERRAQREDVLKKIAVSRAKTAKDAAELRIFENELFRYELELATAEEDLARLYRDIARLSGAKVDEKEVSP